MNHQDRRNFDFNEGLLFSSGSSGRSGIDLPIRKDLDSISDDEVAQALGLRNRTKNSLALPELSEPQICRHFTRLSRWNYAIDTQSYPLGSCTMKYNPKINEWAARQPGFALLHPYMPVRELQGALKLMWELQSMLCDVGGFYELSLQPTAGAHGESVGVMMITAAHRARGEHRHKMLVPDSAHGTNPATAAFVGLDVVPLKTGTDGRIHAEEVAEKMTSDTAGIMVTNPNTLGIFETELKRICDIVHAQGGYVYGDGANLNAIMGIVRPGDLGIDVMHFNLHKTFTTPHGGGGPGCGAVGAAKSLAPYLPSPMVVKTCADTNQNTDQMSYTFDYDRPDSIGRVRSFYGNFAMMVRAFAYMREMGAEGLRQASVLAVLNANYIRARLKDHYHIPYQTDCLHEVVISDKWQRETTDISTLDIAKRLIDYGVHPPTMYFPLIVPGALMIEPTETESKEELDYFCDALIAIDREARSNPELVRNAPHTTALRRVDEAFAARYPVLKWTNGMPTQGQDFRAFAEQINKRLTL
jgi:glycine dehydrogenase subunit 2